jgi:hypothetical protein
MPTLKPPLRGILVNEAGVVERLPDGDAYIETFTFVTCWPEQVDVPVMGEGIRHYYKTDRWWPVEGPRWPRVYQRGK